jgi:acetoin:2,6-dichlorophenolindophenol oxidoreductase subunit beta
MTKQPEVILSEKVNTLETVEMSYVEALRDALRTQMRKDDHVFVIGEEVGNYGGIFGVTQGLYEEFGPERMIDTPISESGFIGAAVGAAITGMRPVAEIMFTDFALVAMDQIVNQAAKIKYMFGGKAQVPLVIRIPTGTGRGAAAQHSQSLEAWFAHIPGLKVVMPSTPFDAKGLLNSAILDNNPIIFIEHKMLYKTTGQVPVEEYFIPIGKADVKREGSDVTIIATLMLLHTALDAAEKLAADGISAEVIDPRTIYPLDKATIIESVKKTNRAVVVHEASKTGGVGGEISAVIMEEAFDYLDAPVLRCAGIDVPIPFSPDLEKIVIPGEKEIIDAVKSLF